MNRKQIRTRKPRGRVRDKCGRQMERRKRVVPREVCVKCSERSNRSCETVLSTQNSAEVIVVKEYQWCAKAWHTNSDRPNHSTGNSATANANLRTLLIENELWISSEQKCKRRNSQGKGVRRARIYLCGNVRFTISSSKKCQSIKPSLERIKVYARGWLNYYGIASRKNNIEDINGWLYHRIRMCIWKQWKKPKTKVRNLLNMGVPKELELQAGNSRRGDWFTTHIVAINMAMTKERLINSGFYDLATAYQSVHVNY